MRGQTTLSPMSYDTFSQTPEGKIVSIRFRGPYAHKPTANSPSRYLNLSIAAPPIAPAVNITSEFADEHTVADVKRFALSYYSNAVSDQSQQSAAKVASGRVEMTLDGAAVGDNVLVRDIARGKNETTSIHVIISCSESSPAQRLPIVKTVHLSSDDAKLVFRIAFTNTDLVLDGAVFQLPRAMQVSAVLQCVKFFCSIKASFDPRWRAFKEAYSRAPARLLRNGLLVDESSTVGGLAADGLAVEVDLA